MTTTPATPTSIRTPQETADRSIALPAITLPAVTAGFATTVLVWVAWWFVHLPAMSTPDWLAEFVLVMALPVAALLAARDAPGGRHILAGLLTAAVSTVLDLVVLGAAAVDRSSDAGAASVAQLLGGFLLLSAVLGAGGGLAAKLAGPRRMPLDGTRWLGRFAVVACLSFLPLIVVGGAVTSTESGMAVDEPAVSLIMPLSTMEEPRVYLEHTHRLFGSLVGLTTLTWLGLAIWRRAGRAPITIAAVVFGLVCVQGLLGAFRVAENSPWIAALHGVFGQLVFATAVFGAARFSPLWSDDDHGETSWPEATRRAGGRAAFLAALALGALAFQLLTGSMSRHLASGHAAITHVVFAFGAAMLVTLAGATMLSAERFSRIGTVLRQLGRGMIAVVVIQVALGLFALVAVGGGDAVRPIPLESELGQAHAIEVGEALVTTAHQSNGALLLALATLSVAWTRHAARD